jgi:hypothetical protein
MRISRRQIDSRRSMVLRRRFVRLLARLGGLLLLAVAAAFAVKRALPTYLRDPLENQLAQAGFPTADFEIESVGLAHLRLSNLALAPDLRIAQATIKFGRWGILGQRIETVVLKGARWTTRLDERVLRTSSLARILELGDLGEGDSPSPSIHLENAQIVIERNGEDALLGVDGRVLLENEHAELMIESTLGRHRASATLHRSAHDESIAHLDVRDMVGTSDGNLTVRFSRNTTSPREWKVAARFPAEWLPQSTSSIGLSGLIELRSKGSIHPTFETRFSLENITARATLSRFQAPNAGIALENVRAVLSADGTLDMDREHMLTLDIDPASNIEVDRASIDEWQAEGLALKPDVRVTLTSRELSAIPRAPISLVANTLSIGSGKGALRLHDPEITLSEIPGQPILEANDARGQLGFELDGEAPRLRGALRGQGVHARGRLVVDFGPPNENHLDGHFRLTAIRIIEPQSQVSLAQPRMNLDIREDAERNVIATGRVDSRTLSFDGYPFGRVRGSVRIADDRVSLDWSSPRFRTQANIGLEHGDGYAHIDVPWTILRNGDSFHRVLANRTGFEITGHAAGRLRINLQRPKASRAELELHDATVVQTAYRHRATGVRAALRLVNLDPVVSEAATPVSFQEIVLDDMVTLGRGTARLHFERSGQVGIEDAVAALGGGRVHAAPLRFDPDAPELALNLSFEGVDVDRFMHAISDGHASGSGKLDGRIGMRVAFGQAPKLVLGNGRFAARGQGRIRIAGDIGTPRRPVALEQLGSSEWVQDRVIHALHDFEYSRLVLDVVGNDDSKRVVARLAGRGARTPQELDLTLNVRGIQPVVDELLDLWRETNSSTR